MKTMCISYVVGAVILASVLGGCRNAEKVTHASQLRDPSEGSSLRVLTKDGTIYALDSYFLKDTVLIGSGQITSSKPKKEFMGRLNLREISYIEARYSNTLMEIAKIGIGLFVVGTAVSYAGEMVGGLSMREGTERVTYSNAPSGGGGGRGSCPHVYSIEGNSAHFESETFAGAVFKGAEHPAFDVLTHVAPLGGVLKLKIVNESLETEYTNEMKIIAIDAPADVTVVPDSKGVIHTLAEKTSPMECHDFAGEKRLDEIRDRDGRFWQSEFEKKDLTKLSELHDGLVLTFPKPVGTHVAKLVVTGTNTKLAMFSLEQLFKLRGDNKLRWYQQLENNPEERKRFIKFMMRDGMLHVKIWQRNQWVEQGAFVDVGPYKVKPQIVILDVSQVLENEIKLKLEATTDLWRIDEVFIDYSTDQNVSTEEISPFQAITESGTDVAGTLLKSDGQYCTMVMGQYAIASFTLPFKRSGRTRTYVLKTQGYYYQWFDSQDEDHPEEIQKMLDQPLYGSAKILPLWRKVKSAYW